MTDKRINIIIDSRQAQDGAKKIDRSVKDVGKSADESQFKLNRLAIAIKAAIAGGALTKAVGTLVKAQREFDRLNASLVTATGSIDGAGIAFAHIERLAAETPFSVEQVTEAFIKLRNLGLDPSEEAIISYGNTAAAMGKDLSQLIEAVADATTGEFERLKEFGIKARSEGDKIALTFQGTTQRIQNNAQSIEQYLQSLGNEQFAGAVNARIQTLDGAISNLGDAWSTLVRSIGAAGASDTIEKAVRLLTEGVQQVSDAIRSGQLNEAFGAWALGFEGFAKDFNSLLNGVLSVYSEFTEEVGLKSGDISGFLSSAFLDAGPNIRAFIQLMTVEVAGTIDRVASYASYLKTVISDLGFENASSQLEADLNRINAARTDSINLILGEAEAAKQATALQIESSRQLRLEYEKNSSNSGGLGQFRIEGGADQAENAKSTKIQEQLNQETQSLQRELELRKSISQIYRQNELAANATQFEQEMAQIAIQEQTRLAEAEARYQEDLARRQLQFEQRLESAGLEETAKLELENQFRQQQLIAAEIFEQDKVNIEKEGVKQRQALAKLEAESRLNAYAGLAKSGLQLLQSFGSDSFKTQKRFAIADGIINIATGVTKALNNPFPANLGFAARVAAQGAKLMSTIKSTNPGATALPSVSSVSSSAPEIPTASSVTETKQEPKISTTVALPSDGIIVDMASFIDRLNEAVEDGAGPVKFIGV